jgi:hypothetical protein
MVDIESLLCYAKVMKIGNRDLARAFNFSLTQVRRWAVLVLGTDPEADKGDGVSRNYDLDSAFRIFLAGILVSRYRMSLKQTQTHLVNISHMLAEEELFPSEIQKMEEIPEAELTIFSGETYSLRKDIEKPKVKMVTNSGEEIQTATFPSSDSTRFDIQEHYSERFYPLNIYAPAPGPRWVINLTKYLKQFIEQSKESWGGNIIE